MRKISPSQALPQFVERRTRSYTEALFDILLLTYCGEPRDVTYCTVLASSILITTLTFLNKPQ